MTHGVWPDLPYDAWKDYEAAAELGAWDRASLEVPPDRLRAVVWSDRFRSSPGRSQLLNTLRGCLRFSPRHVRALSDRDGKAATLSSEGPPHGRQS
jgi:hypothetical protein